MTALRPAYPFEVRSRDLLRIALPAAVAFITEPLAGVSDVAVIGRLGDAALLGGVVLGALVFDFIFSLAYFLRLGTAGLTAQSVGARDPHDGLVHFLRAALLAMLLGLVLIAVSGPLLWIAGRGLAPEPAVSDALGRYFAVRIWSAPFSLLSYALLGWFYGRGIARTGMLLQFLVHGVDIIASIGFVYGLGWSIEGSALGTVLGQVVATSIGMLLVFRHVGGWSQVRAATERQPLFDPAALRRMFGLSRDLMIRSAALMSAYALFAAQGSRAGETTLAANAVLLNAMMVTAYFLDGLAQAAEQLCGKAVGANWRPAFERAIALAMRWGLAIAGALTILWLLFGPAVVDLMTTNTQVRAFARDYLVISAIAIFAGMPAFVMDGVLTGATLNDTMRNGMVFAFALFLLAVAVLQPLWGNTGLWLALIVLFVARAGYFYLALLRRKSRLFAAA